jgi:hypothetical protein
MNDRLQGLDAPVHRPNTTPSDILVSGNLKPETKNSAKHSRMVLRHHVTRSSPGILAWVQIRRNLQTVAHLCSLLRESLREIN